MARPARLFPHPVDQAFAPLNLINVNFITNISISSPPTPPLVHILALQMGLSSVQVTYTSLDEALAAAEVWRARVDDAP